MKIGDRVLLYPYPCQAHIAPTLGIVTRLHQTGMIDATMFADMDTIRDLSFPVVKAIGPVRVVADAGLVLTGYRGGFVAVPIDQPEAVAHVTELAAAPVPKPKPRHIGTR